MFVVNRGCRLRLLLVARRACRTRLCFPGVPGMAVPKLANLGDRARALLRLLSRAGALALAVADDYQPSFAVWL